MPNERNKGLSSLVLNLFRWFCRPEYHADIEGDLLELFEIRKDEHSVGYAHLLLVLDILFLFRPSIIKPISSFRIYKHPIMLRKNISIAWRYLLKNKLVTIINFTGLIVGMTAALFIWQYVHYERSYDRFHEKADRIFRIRTDRVDNGVTFMQFAGGTAAAANLVADNFAAVEDFVKLKRGGEAIFSYGDNPPLRENRAYFATPSIFDVFSFPLVKGNAKTCLSKPFTACLSETAARKLFGDEDPIGQTIRRNKTQEVEVTGVFADCPENSHLKFDILMSYVTFSDVMNPGGQTERSLTWDGFFSYVLLEPGTDWKALEAQIPATIAQNYDEHLSESVVLHLQPLSDIHLNSNYLIEAEVNGDGNVVLFLFFIGISVLLIAWFNYINLTTASSELRAKEVGVRKVIGGTRRSLINQFLTEAGLLSFFAIVVSFGLVWVLQPFFEQLIGKDLPITMFSDGRLLLITLAVLIVGTLLSGLYPAFLLSSYKPIKILKGGFSGEELRRSNWLSKSLVSLQFAAAIALIAGTLIVNRQLSHLQETKLGLSIDQTLVVRGPRVTDSTFVQKSTVFKQKVEQLGTVTKLAASTSIPGQSFGWTAGGVHRIGTLEEESENFHVMAADADYTELYQMGLAAGRHMTTTMGSDGKTACLLNETGAQLLKFNSPQEAIGKNIEFWGEEFTIIGVLKDFYQESPKSVVEPLVLRARPAEWGVDFYSIKLNAQQLSRSINEVESTWNSLFPGNPFEYFFLDDHFNKQYESEQRFRKVFTLFSGLAIFVSCMGLFALVTFITERKRKEIGVRRVLGASIGNIVSLLFTNFLILVLVALVVATPLAWYAMQHWLEGFANRIDMPWWFFAISGILAIAVAFITVGFQSVRAAMTNPVESLRTE